MSANGTKLSVPDVAVSVSIGGIADAEQTVMNKLVTSTHLELRPVLHQ